MPETIDTVVARATAPGRSGVAMVRVSGPRAERILRAIAGTVPAPRLAKLARFHDAQGNTIDRGLCLWFPGPASFTGEDLAEFHCHGGPVVVDLLVEACLAAGARQATPGEFSQRAFLNDKLDLTQAEAIADLIDSGTEAAARAASRSLEGALSKAMLELTEAVTRLRVHVEAAMDFPEEDEDFLQDQALLQRVEATASLFAQMDKSLQQGCLVREGIRIVIAGAPNAGKSSLLNALVGRDAAIVTDIPGTTRDLVSEQIQIDGMPIHIIDTAGLRETADPVEIEGVRRAEDQAHEADLVLLVQDATSLADPSQDNQVYRRLLAQKDRRVIRVLNKLDLTGAPVGLLDGEHQVGISARTGAGLEALKALVKEAVGYAGDVEGLFTARRRHRDALGRAAEHFARAGAPLKEHRAGELAAEDLRETQNALAEITGEFGTEDLLERIFSDFCIGK